LIGKRIGVGEWNRSSSGWLRRDRLHAETVPNPLPSFKDTRTAGTIKIKRNMTECVNDLCRCSNTSRSGKMATMPTISALLKPRIGALNANGIEK
jgi:hypothetical protein